MADTHEDKGEELQAYELGYHLVPSLGEDDLALRVSELVKAATKDGGTLIAEGYPQPFVLAYTMRKLRGGRWDRYDSTFFGWMRFRNAPETIEALKEMLDHNEHLVRYLLVKLPAVALTPAPVRQPKPIELVEVTTEPKQLEKKRDTEEKGEVSEEELDKQLEHLIQ